MEQVKYKMVIEFEIVHELDELTELKSDREYAEDVAKMVCDESTNVNAVVTYDILESGFYMAKGKKENLRQCKIKM